MEFDFNESAQSVATEDFFYDLFDGGYIEPEKLLNNDVQAKEVRDAMELLESFRDSLEDNGLLEFI